MSLVTIEDKQIKSMLKDPRFTQAIPCLASGAASMTNTGKGCIRCNKKKAKKQREILNAIRGCIASLPTAQRSKLKELLGAKKIRVVRRNSQGKAVQVTL